MKTILGLVAVGVSIVIAFMLFVVAGVALFTPLAATSCNKLEPDTGIETKYKFWTGCLVKVNDRYIPLDNWRGERET